MSTEKRPRKPRQKKGASPPELPATTTAASVNGKADRVAEIQQELATRDRPPLLTADKLVERPLEWLVPGLIPRGRLVLIAGEREAGKSTLFAALVAQVTAGAQLIPSEAAPLGRVLLFSAEEDLETETLGRLRSACACLNRVHLGDRSPGGGPMTPMHLPDRHSQLRDLIRQVRAHLLVMDPITAYLSPGIDLNSESHVRSVLKPMRDLAEQEGCTICYTCHLRKGRGGSAADWVLGSGAWTNVPRFVLSMGRDPHDERRRVIAWTKCSVAKRPPSMRYEIVDHEGHGVLRITEQSTCTAEEIGMHMEGPWERDAIGEAMAFLKLALSEEKRLSDELFIQAQKSGISVRTLRRAKLRLGITASYEMSAGVCRWHWERPKEWPE